MSKSVCPFCLWAACGLVLLLIAPELLGVATRLGPLVLWLVAIPFMSAVLRRWLRPMAT